MSGRRSAGRGRQVLRVRGDWESILSKAKATSVAAPYKAARPDRLVGGYGRFRRGVDPAEERRVDLLGLVAHSRWAQNNSDYYAGFLRSVRRNVAGPKGFRFRPNVRDAMGNRDTEANKVLRDLWGEWGERGEPTVCGKHSIKTAIDAILTMTARDGQCFVRHYPGRGRFGYRFKILPIDLLDLDKITDLGGGRRVLGGIEFDQDDRVLAYWMFQASPGLLAASRRGLRSQRIPAEEIEHVHLPFDAGQVLDVPWGQVSLRRFSQVEDFEENALGHARLGASHAGWITQEDDLAGDPVEGDEEEAELVIPSDLRYELLQPGMGVEKFDARFPDQAFGPFVDAQLRGAAAGVGVSYATLTSDLNGANFSSLRAGLGQERDEWRMLQALVIDIVLRPIWLRLLPMAMLTPILAGFSMRDEPRLLKVEFTGRGWPAVNPKEEAAADKQRLDDGTISPQQIVAREGLDLEQVLEERAEAAELAEIYGVELRPGAGGQAVPALPGVTDPDDPEDDDAEDAEVENEEEVDGE